MEGQERKVKSLSPEFIQCPRDDLIILVARMLNSLISINDKYNSDSLAPENLTRFHSRTPPGISVYSYLARLSRYSSIENAVLIAAVYYIDLLSAIYSSFTLNSLTVHRFLLTATTVGSKGLCDSFCTNSHYAKVGGIHPTELDILEREFLTKVNYRILPRDLNIKNCANEKKIENSQEARGSACSIDYDETMNEAEQESGKQPTEQWKLKNAGYNVLDIYYKKMVILVGKEVSADDGDLKEYYEYIIDDKLQTSEIPDTMIKTEYDTLPDESFQRMINDLLRQLSHRKNSNDERSQIVNNNQNNTGDFQIHNNTTQNLNNNKTTSAKTTKNISLSSDQPQISSPMKRPFDPDSELIPFGKRSSVGK